MTTRRSPGPKRDACHDLWLHPLIEHATKDGQAVSTPFWSTGSNRGLPTKARDAIHRPAIGGEHAVTEPRAIGEEHGPPRKAEENHQKNKRTRNPENDGAGTVALFITESPKHRKVPNMGL
ncbi:hypothetical protein CDL15_Pgr008632 [Punica granatum]|uniref:Uncharacterized protein n=1 Tax=Punica granatum TaxID=22663 RepID=A0A218XE33_PUNGR|nr:hypothetical protein CDL15_Pgr008632 [Punica granatum]